MSEQPTYEYDVFISYSPEDKPWVETMLLPHLEQSDLRYIDEVEFRLGHPKIEEITRAVKVSRHTLLILTQHYLSNNWGNFEKTLSVTYGIENGRWSTIPLIKEPCELPQLLQSLVSLNFSDPEESTWQKLTETLRSKPHIKSSRLVRQGIHAMIELMKQPELREAVIVFQTDFQEACEQIELVSGYKRMHDLFQILEDLYNLLDKDRKRLKDDETAWDDMEDYVPKMQGTIEDLLKTAGQAAFAADAAQWMRKLEHTQEHIQQAFDDSDEESLATVTRQLSRLFERELSRINTRLVATAELLRLKTLVEAMTTIETKLSLHELDEAAAQQVEELKEGVQALAGLNQSIVFQVDNHNTLQRVDDELRRIVGNLDDDIDELEDSWPDVQFLIESLRESAEAEWLIKLNETGTKLETALTDENASRAKQFFRRYRSQFSRSFNQADADLLSLCEELQNIGDPLASVLKTLGGG